MVRLRGRQGADVNYVLKRPCPHCPFRSDIPAYLSDERVGEIQDALERGGTFACHETTVEGDDGEMVSTVRSQHCAGALILLEVQNDGRNGGPGCLANQMARFAQRFSGFDPDKLDIESPVYASFDDMRAAQPR